MPQILELKVDSTGVWVRIPHKTFNKSDGVVTLYNNLEIDDIKRQERERLYQVLIWAGSNPDKDVGDLP